MRIDALQTPMPVRRVSAAGVPPVPAVPRVRRGEGERVEISTMAAELAKARSPAVIDEARVERIREAILQARLPIDGERIAGKMMLEER
ncbi:MAG: flagellar biosynthesis anti-sigma factor FlgM [Myxococcota bacterium]